MSYSEIINVLEAELESEKLQSIDFNFYTKAKKYLDTLEKNAKKGTLELEKTIFQNELNFLTLVLYKIFLIRIRKIIDGLFKGDFSKDDIGRYLAKEEKELVHYMTLTIKELCKREESSVKMENSDKDKNNVVVFRRSYPVLILNNGNTVGPFLAGDIAYLPDNIVKELLNNGVVEVID